MTFVADIAFITLVAIPICLLIFVFRELFK